MSPSTQPATKGRGEGIIKALVTVAKSKGDESLPGKPAGLRAMVDKYNDFCAQGYDKLFAENREHLRPGFAFAFNSSQITGRSILEYLEKILAYPEK